MTAGRGGRPRVLHVGKFYPPHMGGMETHLQALCEALRDDLEIEVLVAAEGRRGSDEVLNGVRVRRTGTILTFASASICPGLAGTIRTTPADVVHVHLPNPTGILAYLASGHPGRLVVTYHSDVVRQRLLGSLFEPVLDRFLGRAAAILATSPDYAATSPVLRRFPDRCRVVPYGIAHEAFAEVDPEAVARLRQQFGPRVVIAVGRLIYYKGFEVLVRAMAEVRGRLLLVGDGPLRAPLEELAAAAGVGDRVSFLGEIQNRDVAPYYHASDVFALPSIARSEAFGIVQLEAMACGRPVVNTSLDSGVPFVSLDGVTGLTVPPGDPAALAAALNRILDDAELRARFGAAARHRVAAEFSLERMASRTLAVYREALAGPPGS